ncbi:hypothetical protein M9Y10_007035 [Tritrichomonas musculus]|uniref:U-box domain containing protein n=1 Tax=Tritrichomonas musculus TaxID=1915356 RepID=A0ABR2J2W4_9EUKA
MPIKKNANIKRREKKAKNRSYTQNEPSEEKEEEEKEEKPELPKEDDKEKPATDDALDTDLDPLADLDNDAPPEFICPITMSVMKDPVIMPDGQTYEREAIQRALSVNPISPVTREPMDMSQATTNYALKNLIDKYIQSHIQEIEKEPTIIDPTTMFQQDQQPSPEIPIIELDKIPIETFSAQYTTDSMLITVKPQQINGRLPVSIIAIIDISSSMIIDATIHDNSSEDTSISRIQLVQYSLKTIISTLGESDQLTIITFNGKAHVKASGVLLTREGKERVNKIIDDIDPDGMTNLWDGLDKGINEAIKQQNKRMNTSLLVFTDGQPNVHPPMGLIPTLKEKLSDFNVYFSISTFGYGYNIDADLLEEIAEIGSGVYGYIPDASMVGTIFINYLSNLVSTVSPLATLTVNFDNKKPKKFNVVLYNGSSTNVMLSLGKNEDPEKAQINLNLILSNESLLVSEIKKLDENDEESCMTYNDQKYRKLLIDLILNTKEKMPISGLRDDVIQLFEKLKNEKNRSQFMKYLMIDLYNDDEQHGDIERAYHKDNFNKWGKNYLFSLLRFHMLEQCGNFRDMSLQLYGNESFLKFRKFGNKIFMNLPIPEKKDPYERSRKKRVRAHFSDSDDSDDSSDQKPQRSRGFQMAFRGRPRPRPKCKNRIKRRRISSDDDDDSESSSGKVSFDKSCEIPERRKMISEDSSENDSDDNDDVKMGNSDSSDEKQDMDDRPRKPQIKAKTQKSRSTTMRMYNQRRKQRSKE